MQRLEVSCAVRLIYMSLGAKGLTFTLVRVTIVEVEQAITIKYSDSVLSTVVCLGLPHFFHIILQLVRFSGTVRN